MVICSVCKLHAMTFVVHALKKVSIGLHALYEIESNCNIRFKSVQKEHTSKLRMGAGLTSCLFNILLENSEDSDFSHASRSCCYMPTGIVKLQGPGTDSGGTKNGGTIQTLN